MDGQADRLLELLDITTKEHAFINHLIFGMTEKISVICTGITDTPTDGNNKQTEGHTDGPTERRIGRLIEMRWRIFKFCLDIFWLSMFWLNKSRKKD